MDETTNTAACCCLLVVIIFAAFFFFNIPGGNHSYRSNLDDGELTDYEGTFNVVNNTLTNGTYNITNLNKTIDVVNSYETYYDVVPSDFIFVYNDFTTTTKYDGDAGLLYSEFNDTITGSTYRANRDLTRGIAYHTNKKFNLSDGITIRRNRNSGDNYYTVYSYIKLKNGSFIDALSISENLTDEEKKYFVDYDEQLYRHNAEKQIKQLKNEAQYLADMDTEISVQNRIDAKSDGKSFSGISSRGEYIYGHAY